MILETQPDNGKCFFVVLIVPVILRLMSIEKTCVMCCNLLVFNVFDYAAYNTYSEHGKVIAMLVMFLWCGSCSFVCRVVALMKVL